MKIAFLYLKTFDAIGGIEKFNRAFMKALDSLSDQLKVCSVYDTQFDEVYVKSKNFVTYKGSKLRAIFGSLLISYKSKIFILGHINLAVIGWLIKIINPQVKLILIAHGVEVWAEQTGFKKKLLSRVDQVLAVSQYTKQLMCDNNGLSPDKVSVFPNTIDPTIIAPQSFQKDISLLKQYNLSEDTPIILTVSRLSSVEGYKGYDGVIEAIPVLKKVYPKIKYFIVGKADSDEQLRIAEMIDRLNVKEQVILTGYVSDEILDQFYQTADVFAMPSKGEGFGIVFIEAMVYGMRVIAGNVDGSVDALNGGKFGTLVNPDSIKELEQALRQALQDPFSDEQKMRQQEQVYELFGFSAFQNRLEQVLQ